MALVNSCCCLGLRPAVLLLGVLSLLGGMGYAGKSCWDLLLVIDDVIDDDLSSYLLPPTNTTREELFYVTQELNPQLGELIQRKDFKLEVQGKQARSLGVAPPIVSNLTQLNEREQAPSKITTSFGGLAAYEWYRSYLQEKKKLIRYVLIPMFVVNIVCGVITAVYSCLLLHGARKGKQYLLVPILIWWPIHAAIQILFICLLKMLVGVTNPYPWSIATIAISAASLLWMIIHWIATFSLRQQMKQMKNFPVGFYNHPQLPPNPMYSHYQPGVYMGHKANYS